MWRRGRHRAPGKLGTADVREMRLLKTVDGSLVAGSGMTTPFARCGSSLPSMSTAHGGQWFNQHRGGACGQYGLGCARFPSATPCAAPLAPTGLVFSPSDLPGGTSTEGWVVLNRISPSSATAVQLGSSGPAVAAPPPTVSVAAGSASALFTMNTNVVAVDTDVTISGALVA